MCLYGAELKRTHEKDLDNLEKTLKQTETSLSVRPLGRAHPHRWNPHRAVRDQLESPSQTEQNITAVDRE